MTVPTTASLSSFSNSYIERPRWSCALGGALAAAGNLPQTVPILHAGPGCAGNFAWTNNGASGLNVTGQCVSLSVPSTNLQETEIVFGGLERLREEITHALEIMEGELYFVLTGCLPEVIGDDVESLVEEFVQKKNPVVLASTPGFKGDSYLGYDQVLKTIIKNVVKPSSRQNPNLINIWGLPPTLDPFWRGNLEGLRELTNLLGLEANIFFGPNSDLKAVKKAASASLNVVVSGLYGLEAAELFKELHGVDYLKVPLPFGAASSERFLKSLGSALKISLRKINKVIASAGQKHYSGLEPIIDVYNDMEAQRHALVVGDANYALALTDFLAQDLGWVPELTVITNDLTDEAKQSLLNYHSQNGGTTPQTLIFETRVGVIKKEADIIWNNNKDQYYDTKRPIFVVGSSLERELASQLGANHLSVSYPVSNRAILTRGYTGFSGGLTLTEDLVSAFIAGR